MRAAEVLLALTLSGASWWAGRAWACGAGGRERRPCDVNKQFHIKPTLYNPDGSSSDTEIAYSPGNKIFVPYDSLVQIYCYFDYDLLKKEEPDVTVAVSRDGMVLETLKLNSRAWSTNVIKLHAPEQTYKCHMFDCEEIETVCGQQNTSVTIVETPRLDVIPTKVQYVRDKFIVEYGSSMSVLCSGPDAARLQMSTNGSLLPTAHVSTTAIRHFVKDPDLQASEYICVDTNTSLSTRVAIAVVPTIYFRAQNVTITPSITQMTYYGLQFHEVDYRESIEVFCYGPRAVKLLYQGEDNWLSHKYEYVPMPEELTENVNETTVKVIRKLELGKWYFGCSDSEHLNNGYLESMNAVKVEVLPRIEVRSPNVRNLGPYGRYSQIYAVHYGDPYEIVCHGKPYVSLNMVNRPWYTGRSGNSTVITRKAEHTWMFKCYSPKSICDSCEVSVLVGVLPAAQDVMNFHCNTSSAHGTQQLQHFKCSWAAVSPDVNFTLFYMENNVLIPVCKIPSDDRQQFRTTFFNLTYAGDKWKPKLCTWANEYDNKQNASVFSLLMKTCNFFGCSNQSFYIDRSTHKRLDPPKGLKVLNTSSRGAVLRWDMTTTFPREDVETAAEDVDYRAEYRYSGSDIRHIDSTRLKCQYPDCKIELDLLCPNENYEVKIYQKLKKAVGDQYWSEPSSITFLTDVENN